MSKQYDEYIKEHKSNVYEAFKWLTKNVPQLFEYDEDLRANCEYQCLYEHDKSKNEPDEYEAYDAYFYGGNRSYNVVNDFDKAWLKHIHRNEHHWQHWILVKDDPEESEVILDMPDMYIIEMICDWWSFSFKKGNLYEIFDWYEERKDHIKLSYRTRIKVKNILNMIKAALDNQHVKLTDEDDDNA